MKMSFLAFGVIVAKTAWCDQWYGAVTPVGAHVEDDSNMQVIYFQTTQAVFNPHACVATDGYELSDPVIVNAAYATILAAIASGQQVYVYVSSSACVNGRPDAVLIEIGQN